MAKRPRHLRWLSAQACAVCLVLAACQADAPTPSRTASAEAHAADARASRSAATSASARATAVAAATARPSHPLSDAARAQIGVTRVYDPAYVRIAYPGGDVAPNRGVCTDVVIRALRTQGIDLQRRIHEDRIAHPAAYPARWRDRATDSNIDHRRVPNQMAWFDRQGWSAATDDRAASYRAGDIVAWDLGGGVLHVGIVSERSTGDGTPLILHNIGRGTQEQDLLFKYRIIGHYRPPPLRTAG